MFAIYDNPSAAGRGVERLLEESFDAKRIRIIFFDDDGPEEVVVKHHTRAGVGAALGALLGTIVGAAATTTGFVTPEIGVIGGLASGLAAGALAGITFWKKEVELPRSREAGGVLVAVPAESEGRQKRARRAFESSGGRILAHGASASAGPMAAGVAA